ncbi:MULTISPECIES: LysR family transcriptional regulator [unclassified Pseudomonas]|jgi:DNA-binding transcriptional LysR family regulator|uniref:LysR family transcriptional regulator n=1 Tax=unclassified Pseudomonas TaxID=196821 RepID=UPI00025E93AC|nr:MULTISPECIES: LysR family transcriptional regulator [unclassified Pseudomonas]AFJ57948.1 transcriptional regulator, LysR family [Pseudomonas fluorescens A506]MBH3399704.1 LysR family transcriptional regulator [Pseudomonas fluorescens]MBK3429588.1 LysR family transcriptional regulator [Pseudomonas fluorescens]MBK3480449.1 LysR family transcriptional regulator [Pseudomonas fluorescens]MEB0193412.1 LysR family transcriptional regulator [Pseudomonas sp. CCI1.1]
MATPRFDGVELFLQIVERGNLTEAAERLNLTRSAVGKGLARLEARLGTCLLQRSTRRQRLTEDGQAYYEHCLRALAELEAAESVLESGRQQPRGRLRVSVPLAFGHHYAAPALWALLDRYPELEIDLCFSDRMIDLVQEGFDMAVRIGPLPDTDRLSARRLGQQAMGLAASPAYLQRKGAIDSIDDLAAHRGIAYRSNTAQRSRLASPLIVDDLQAVADAAIAGVGLAWLPSWLIAHYALRGQLQAVLPSYREQPAPIHVIWPTAAHMPAKTRCAIDALVAATPSCLAGS